LTINISYYINIYLLYLIIIYIINYYIYIYILFVVFIHHYYLFIYLLLSLLFLFFLYCLISVKTLASVPSRASNKNGKSKYRFPTGIAFVWLTRRTY